MTKVKIEKIIIISFIGLIVAFFVGLGGNIIIIAGSPASVSKTEINFEKRLQQLEDDMASGKITKYDYDSLTEILHIQMQQQAVLQYDSLHTVKMPGWVTRLGINEPQGMKLDPVFSSYTFEDDPSEGFNSVTLVYAGEYNKAMKEATKIASNAKLFAGGNFKAKGSPVNLNLSDNPGVSYLNYNLENADQDFLISVQVAPSGRLTIMVTDNKQLNERLLAYEPLNNRQNSALKRKKQ